MRPRELAAAARARPGAALAAVLAVLYAVGLLGHALPATRGLMLALTPWFLAATGAAALALAWPAAGGRRLALWTAAAYAATLGLEIAGVATGAVFGAYRYGGVLGVQVAGVPLVIGLNWVLVILGLAGCLARLPGGRWWSAPVVGLLAAGFDWIMEPVAVRLDYWAWAAADIPLRNYAAWFAIALAAAAAFAALGVRLRRQTLLALVLAQALFFAALRCVL